IQCWALCSEQDTFGTTCYSLRQNRVGSYEAFSISPMYRRYAGYKKAQEGESCGDSCRSGRGRTSATGQNNSSQEWKRHEGWKCKPNLSVIRCEYDYTKPDRDQKCKKICPPNDRAPFDDKV